MAQLPIRIYGDPILRRKAAPVERFDEELRQLGRDMIETMILAPGVGLAAPQVGLSIRLLVADGSRHEGDKPPRIFVNPEILEAWSEWTYDEGCLSVPGLTAELTRPEAIRLRFQDENGTLHEEEFHGLWARVLQHEIDHLNGKLFVDYMSPMRRAMIMKKLRDLAKESKGRITV
jgi:peptide deformylase